MSESDEEQMDFMQLLARASSPRTEFMKLSRDQRRVARLVRKSCEEVEKRVEEAYKEDLRRTYEHYGHSQRVKVDISSERDGVNSTLVGDALIANWQREHRAFIQQERHFIVQAQQQLREGKDTVSALHVFTVLSEAEVIGLRKTFDHYDGSTDERKFTPELFRDLLFSALVRSGYSAESPEAEAQLKADLLDMFDAVDADGSGDVSWDEFTHYMLFAQRELQRRLPEDNITIHVPKIAEVSHRTVPNEVLLEYAAEPNLLYTLRWYDDHCSFQLFDGTTLAPKPHGAKDLDRATSAICYIPHLKEFIITSHRLRVLRYSWDRERVGGFLQIDERNIVDDVTVLHWCIPLNCCVAGTHAGTVFTVTEESLHRRAFRPGVEIKVHKEHVTSIVIMELHARAISACLFGDIKVSDLKRGTVLMTLPGATYRAAGAHKMLYVRQQNFLLVAGLCPTPTLWMLVPSASSAASAAASILNPEKESVQGALIGHLSDCTLPHTENVIALWCNESMPNMVLTLDASGMAKTWDMRTMRCVDTQFTHLTQRRKVTEEAKMIAEAKERVMSHTGVGTAAGKAAAAAASGVGNGGRSETQQNHQDVILAATPLPGLERMISFGARCADHSTFMCDIHLIQKHDLQKIRDTKRKELRVMSTCCYHPQLKLIVTTMGRDIIAYTLKTGRIEYFFEGVTEAPITALGIDDAGRRIIVGTGRGELLQVASATGSITIRYRPFLEEDRGGEDTHRKQHEQEFLQNQNQQPERAEISSIWIKDSLAFVASQLGVVRLYAVKGDNSEPLNEISFQRNRKFTAMAYHAQDSILALADGAMNILFWEVKLSIGKLVVAHEYRRDRRRRLKGDSAIVASTGAVTGSRNSSDGGGAGAVDSGVDEDPESINLERLALNDDDDNGDEGTTQRRSKRHIKRVESRAENFRTDQSVYNFIKPTDGEITSSCSLAPYPCFAFADSTSHLSLSSSLYCQPNGTILCRWDNYSPRSLLPATNTSSVTALCFLPHSTELLTADDVGCVVIWDALPTIVQFGLSDGALSRMDQNTPGGRRFKRPQGNPSPVVKHCFVVSAYVALCAIVPISSEVVAVGCSDGAVSIVSRAGSHLTTMVPNRRYEHEDPPFFRPILTAQSAAQADEATRITTSATRAKFYWNKVRINVLGGRAVMQQMIRGAMNLAVQRRRDLLDEEEEEAGDHEEVLADAFSNTASRQRSPSNAGSHAGAAPSTVFSGFRSGMTTSLLTSSGVNEGLTGSANDTFTAERRLEKQRVMSRRADVQLPAPPPSPTHSRVVQPSVNLRFMPREGCPSLEFNPNSCGPTKRQFLSLTPPPEIFPGDAQTTDEPLLSSLENQKLEPHALTQDELGHLQHRLADLIQIEMEDIMKRKFLCGSNMERETSSFSSPKPANPFQSEESAGHLNSEGVVLLSCRKKRKLFPPSIVAALSAPVAAELKQTVLPFAPDWVQDEVKNFIPGLKMEAPPRAEAHVVCRLRGYNAAGEWDRQELTGELALARLLDRARQLASIDNEDEADGIAISGETKKGCSITAGLDLMNDGMFESDSSDDKNLELEGLSTNPDLEYFLNLEKKRARAQLKKQEDGGKGNNDGLDPLDNEGIQIPPPYHQGNTRRMRVLKRFAPVPKVQLVEGDAGPLPRPLSVATQEKRAPHSAQSVDGGVDASSSPNKDKEAPHVTLQQLIEESNPSWPLQPSPLLSFQGRPNSALDKIRSQGLQRPATPDTIREIDPATATAVGNTSPDRQPSHHSRPSSSTPGGHLRKPPLLEARETLRRHQLQQVSRDPGHSLPSRPSSALQRATHTMERLKEQSDRKDANFESSVPTVRPFSGTPATSFSRARCKLGNKFGHVPIVPAVRTMVTVNATPVSEANKNHLQFTTKFASNRGIRKGADRKDFADLDLGLFNGEGNTQNEVSVSRVGGLVDSQQLRDVLQMPSSKQQLYQQLHQEQQHPLSPFSTSFSVLEGERRVSRAGSACTTTEETTAPTTVNPSPQPPAMVEEPEIPTDKKVGASKHTIKKSLGDAKRPPSSAATSALEQSRCASQLAAAKFWESRVRAEPNPIEPGANNHNAQTTPHPTTTLLQVQHYVERGVQPRIVPQASTTSPPTPMNLVSTGPVRRGKTKLLGEASGAAVSSGSLIVDARRYK